MSVNKAIVLGRLGQDPELKYTTSGESVCNFSVATSEGWTDKSGQKQEKTEWHRVVTWGKTAENCNKFLHKGKNVYLEGKIQTRSWEDKNGQKRYTTEINANIVQFLGGEKSEAKTDTKQDDFMKKDYDVKTDSKFDALDIPF